MEQIQNEKVSAHSPACNASIHNNKRSTTSNKRMFAQHSNESRVKININDERESRNSSSFNEPSLRYSYNEKISTYEPSTKLSLLKESKAKSYFVRSQIEEKSLDNLKIHLRKIQQFEQEKYRQQQAKNFVQKMQKMKREFQGKALLKKKRQQRKKSFELKQQALIVKELESIQKMRRRKEAQARISFIKQRAMHRQQMLKSRKIFDVEKKKEKDERISKSQRLSFEVGKIQIPKTPGCILGNRYLQESGRIKKRAKTQSASYFDLDENERLQINRLRQKIAKLTNQLKYYN